MGFWNRLLGKDEADDDTPVPDKVLNDGVRRQQLTELEQALQSLVDAMEGAGDRMENPGWQGRARDYSYALGGTRMLLRQPRLTKEPLFELITTIRPLYRGEAPAEYAELAPANDRLMGALAALEEPAPGE